MSKSATPWTVAYQISLPFTISWSLFKIMSLESVMLSNHLILILLSHMHTSRLLSTFTSYHQVLFVCVLVAQSCLTLCDPMDHCPWGSSVHGIFQARILEWVVISFSRGSPQPRDWTQVSCIADRLFTFWATRENSRFYLFLTKYLWWSTGMPVMLQSMGSQRVGHYWATEKQQKYLSNMSSSLYHHFHDLNTKTLKY